MKIRLVTCGMAAVVMAGTLSFLAFSAPAQHEPKKDQAPEEVHRDPRYEANPELKPTPRTPSGKVDFTGFWIDYYTDPVGDTIQYGKYGNSKVYNDHDDTPRYGTHYEQDVSGTEFPVPYKPQFLPAVIASKENTFETLNPADPYLLCKPLGITRLNRGGHHNGLQMIQNDKYIAILYEEAPGPAFRVIYLDGRPHPKNLEKSYMGHSIGYWDGDTLVVDVVGLNDETLLDEVVREGPTAGMLLPHSDQEHVIERWKRTGNVLTYSAVVEDPVMFTRPWIVTPREIRLSPSDDYMQSQGCTPNQGGLIERYTAELNARKAAAAAEKK